MGEAAGLSKPRGGSSSTEDGDGKREDAADAAVEVELSAAASGDGLGDGSGDRVPLLKGEVEPDIGALPIPLLDADGNADSLAGDIGDTENDAALALNVAVGVESLALCVAAESCEDAADGDCDGVLDSDVETDGDGDSEADSEAARNGANDADADADADADTDTDTEPDADAEGDASTEADADGEGVLGDDAAEGVVEEVSDCEGDAENKALPVTDGVPLFDELADVEGEMPLEPDGEELADEESSELSVGSEEADRVCEAEALPAGLVEPDRESELDAEVEAEAVGESDGDCESDGDNDGTPELLLEAEAE